MSLPQVQLIGGPFADSELNVLALGTLVMELSQDEQINAAVGQACGGIKITIKLDASGDVVTSPAQYVLPTDQLTPSGANYTVWAYSAEGELAWGPNYNLLCPLGGGTFNVNDWIPNSVGSSGGNTGGITLQTNGTNNQSQQVLNLTNGANITITDDGAGEIVIASAGSSGPRNRQWHGWTTDGLDAVVSPVDGFGCTPTGSSGSGLGVAPTATTPAMVNINTGASSSVLKYIAANGSPHTVGKTVTLGILGLEEQQAQLPATTTMRVWLGLLGSMPGQAAAYASDTPAFAACAFRYSTNAGDAHWQCVVTDGTTQLTVSSGIVPDTNLHKFAIQFTPPNVLFYIDGALVATVAITTTTLTTATGFCPSITVDNLATSNNVSVNLSYIYWDTNV